MLNRFLRLPLVSVLLAMTWSSPANWSTESTDPLRCDATAVDVPGYAGSIVEEKAGDATPTVHLWLATADQATESASLEALRAACPDRYSSTDVVVHDAKHTLMQLRAWNTTATSMLGLDERVALSRVDVERNGVVVGMRDLERNGPAVAADLEARGVPRDALHLVDASIRQMPTVRSSPLPAITVTGAAALVGLGAFMFWIKTRRRGR